MVSTRARSIQIQLNPRMAVASTYVEDTPKRRSVNKSGRGVIPTYEKRFRTRKTATSGVKKRYVTPTANTIKATSRTANGNKQLAKKCKTITVHSGKFLNHLMDHKIYYDGYSDVQGHPPAKPRNWDELQEVIKKPHPSLLSERFSDEAFQSFKLKDLRAFNERDVILDSLCTIDMFTGDLRSISRDYLFNNTVPITDGSLCDTKPDIVYGAIPESLRLGVREELRDSIVPSTRTDLPILPNFFLEAKGPDGNPAIAMRQACYDGTVGARGMHALQSYIDNEPVYDGNAYTISGIYHYGHLKFYCHHMAPPTEKDGRPKHIMTSLCSYSMVNDRDDFIRGASAYRNLRDWAKEKRDMFIAAANEKYEELKDQAAPIESQHYDASFDTQSFPSDSEESEL
ncbi:hypothetical protein H112_01392 [Trichophyton rubrum D6]|uniref:Uncharacterized protein n=4 Tax=Trichophyton TaxID=5550 RepID=A0A178F6Z2_TRIRU|nr:uncharacterized protein TERG_07039 [Trichophyton rubrum CBS 118892]EZF26522.1 hypothetical protein H100_01386 [Trichophyton rubrum MR850]EZF45500.1 hypothetical protein H102_01381 [Trichophyton rubrum CBS 100081]EZF56147.1 hypothetical protein H103_01391 [Trichophyton rubrum CBS 288.86]EZF66840.1 hypothetical protein H104_01371 [Trichophyton rubrum CBS 289.86]EZF77391.1 hypothetical protein H105_01401 [Trichophyton soudanense CBS 452.61]EZF88090.1 hypothetical protein H110_01389 [Trichophy